jgi:HK97 family phage major capsid protein
LNSNTAGVLRKFKDADGRYIWQEAVTAGQPPRLLGYPAVLCEQMPDVGSNTLPVAFGDFSSGYVVADQGGLRITVDDNITVPGKVKWYLRKRVGGATLDDHAIKVVKAAAS